MPLFSLIAVLTLPYTFELLSSVPSFHSSGDNGIVVLFFGKGDESIHFNQLLSQSNQSAETEQLDSDCQLVPGAAKTLGTCGPLTFLASSKSLPLALDLCSFSGLLSTLRSFCIIFSLPKMFCCSLLSCSLLPFKFHCKHYFLRKFPTAQVKDTSHPPIFLSQSTLFLFSQHLLQMLNPYVLCVFICLLSISQHTHTHTHTHTHSGFLEDKNYIF